jgi:hypothetical protein
MRVRERRFAATSGVAVPARVISVYAFSYGDWNVYSKINPSERMAASETPDGPAASEGGARRLPRSSPGTLPTGYGVRFDPGLRSESSGSCFEDTKRGSDEDATCSPNRGTSVESGRGERGSCEPTGSTVRQGRVEAYTSVRSREVNAPGTVPGAVGRRERVRCDAERERRGSAQKRDGSLPSR